MVISEVKRIAQLAFVDNAVLYGFISGKELLQIVITNIAYVSSVNIVVAGAASVAASAELARCGLGKANSITIRAWRAMVGAMPTAGANSTTIFRNPQAAYMAWQALSGKAVAAKLRAVAFVGVFIVETDAAPGAMQIEVGDASIASATVGTGRIGVLGKAHFVAEWTWHAMFCTVPSVGVVDTTVLFKHLVTNMALNTVIGGLTALTQFGA